MSDKIWYASDPVSAVAALLDLPEEQLLAELDVIPAALMERLELEAADPPLASLAEDGARVVRELGVLREVIEGANAWASRIGDRTYEAPGSRGAPHTKYPQGSAVLAARELAARGYGKLVVLRDVESPEKMNVIRIASAGWSVAGLASRGSPVAGLLIPAEIGDEVRLPPEGRTFEVVRVAHLERYFGAELQLNFDNFKEIIWDGPEGRRGYFDARTTAAMLRRRLEDAAYGLGVGEAEPLPSEQAPDAELYLSDRFYFRATRPQEDLMRSDSHGLVIVLGVAGSGKTSVALGRTKMLCNLPGEADARSPGDVDFRPETAVGFVLNEQLVPYLKGLADRLYLPNLPVREYRDLRQDLLARRRIGIGPRAVGFDAIAARDDLSLLGRISWVRRMDKLVGCYLGKQLISVLAAPPDQQGLDDWQTLVLAVVWQGFVTKVESLARAVEGEPMPEVVFRLQGLVRRLDDVREELTAELEREGWWVREGITARRIDVREIVGRALASGEALGRRDIHGAWEPLLAMRTSPIYPIEVEGEVRKMLSEGRLLGRRSDGTWRPVELVQNPWHGPRMRLRRQRVSSSVRDRLVRILRADELLCDALVASSRGELPAAAGQTEPSDEGAALVRAWSRAEARRLSIEELDVALALMEVMCSGYRGREGRDPISHLVDDHRYSHVFIDEFQDFTEVQLFVMSEQADERARSVTAVGDLAQQLTGHRSSTPFDAFVRARERERHPVTLMDNKRQTPRLAALSAMFRCIGLQDAYMDLPLLPDTGEAPEILISDDLDTTAALLLAQLERIDRRRSVAVICPDQATAEALEGRVREPLRRVARDTQVADRTALTRRFIVHFTEAAQTKGLEFDAVFVPALERFDLRDPLQASALYVALSRPAKHLAVFGSGDCLRHPVYRQLIDGGWLGCANPPPRD